jgi:hypothetical protein
VCVVFDVWCLRKITSAVSCLDPVCAWNEVCVVYDV